MRRLHLAALAALAVPASGCATLVQGSHQYVTVTSRPGRATARAAGPPGISCETPCSLLLPRKRATAIEVAAPGYRTARVALERSLDPLMLGNVVLPPFSILWAAVDLASGAGFRLSPTFVSVDLQPEALLAGAGRPRPQPPSASCVAAAE